MKFINKKTITLSMFFITLVSTCDYWLPAKIVNFYDSEFDSNNGSFIIAIDNPPLTKKAMLSFWRKHKNEILKKTGAIKEGNYLLFVKNKFETQSNEEAVQFCLLRGIKDKNACVNYNDRLFVADYKNFDRVEGYWLTFSDYYDSTSCSIYDRNDGEQEYYNCNDFN